VDSVVKQTLPKLGATVDMEVKPQSVISALDGVEERAAVPLEIRRVIMGTGAKEINVPVSGVEPQSSSTVVISLEYPG
jgi:hypothetical protein